MAAQRAELSIGQVSLSTLDVAAVPEPHELHLLVDPCGRPDRRHTVPEVIWSPGKVHLAAPILDVARDNERAAPRDRIEPRHDLRPQGRPIFVVNWGLDDLAGLVMEDANFCWRIRRAARSWVCPRGSPS
jgi:hypothetical protein